MSTRDGAVGEYALVFECSEGTPPPCDPRCVEDETIECGSTVAGQLAEDDCQFSLGLLRADAFRLSVTEESCVSIELTSRAFDAMVALAEEGVADCEVFAADDNGAGGTDALLTSTLLPGEYLVLVTNAAGRLGPYELSVRCEPGACASICDTCRVGEIDCNDTAQGTLSATDCVLSTGEYFDAWELNLDRDARVAITMESVPIDTYLYVISEDCALTLDSNDDCEGFDLDRSCIDLRLSAGTYFLLTSSYSVAEIGPYTLSVTSGDCPPPDPPCVECQVREITCGSDVRSIIDGSTCELVGAGPIEYWRFTVGDPGAVRIRVRSAEIDPVIALFDAQCEEISRNDDCDGTTTDSCLERSLEAGTYSIGVSSLFSDSGEYTLTIECLGAGAMLPGDCTADGSFHIGDSVCLVRHLFLGERSLPCGDGDDPSNVALLDWSGDGDVDVSDVVGGLNWLFRGGTPHARGFSACIDLANCPAVCE